MVEKSTEDLLLDENNYEHGALFGVNSISWGCSKTFWNTNMAIGAMATWYKTPGQLEELYGKNPLGLQVFLRIYPGLMYAGEDSSFRKRLGCIAFYHHERRVRMSRYDRCGPSARHRTCGVAFTRNATSKIASSWITASFGWVPLKPLHPRSVGPLWSGLTGV